MTGQTPQFRIAGPDDAAPAGEFMARNFLAAYGHCSSPENVARAVGDYYGLPAQQRQLADPARINLLAEIDGALAGVAQLRLGNPCPVAVDPASDFELSRFYVDVAFHGSGLAPAMMARVRQLASDRGASQLWLSVWQQSPQAIRFYEKQGFRIIGATTFMVGDDAMDDWVMLGPT